MVLRALTLSLLLLITEIKSQNDFLTVFEKSNFLSTASYQETMEFFKMLDDSSEYADLFDFGISHQLREMKCLLVTKENRKVIEFNLSLGYKPTEKPLVLIINGIHSGEIEGKDASMLLLREILVTKEKEYLLDSLSLLVIPIFNVDGHERKSKFNRINQNGPDEMGWRTNALNLNLNRDWMKADAAEMQAMLTLVSTWLPDFIIDTHTTNGADYQYEVTYQVEKYQNISYLTADYLKSKFIPHLISGVEQKGFSIFDYVALKDWNKGLESGLIDWVTPPRLSTGYFALQNRPALLVETHMLKPYKNRVFSTKAVIETTLEFIHKNSSEIIDLNFYADETTIADYYQKDRYLPLKFKSTNQFDEVDFKGVEYIKEFSAISGAEKIVYTDKPKNYKLKFYRYHQTTDSVRVPRYYLIPIEYQELVKRMQLHGIEVNTTNRDTFLTVKRYRFNNVKFQEKPYEGRFIPSFDVEVFYEEVFIPKGTFIVSTNQRVLKVITHLLEPKSEDSFVKWGFMNSIFEQKEYFESYVMEKVAEEMLKNDKKLKDEFENKLKTDEEFRNSPYQRLNFFYKKSPYWDKNLNVYPIMIIE
jgi:murein tripeptide amidase MpaA